MSLSSYFTKIITSFTNDPTAPPDQYRGQVLAPTQVTNVPANLYGWNLINPNNAAWYVKFYDQVAMPVVGTDPVVFGALAVPASGATGDGSFGLLGSDCMYYFTKAMWIAVSLTPDDTGTTPGAGNGVYFTLFFKK